MQDYDFDSLGWFRFERLCQTLLQAAHGLGIECWGGSGDGGRDAYSTDELELPGQPPYLFQVKFVEDAVALKAAKASGVLLSRIKAECREINKRKTAKKWPPVRTYVVMSNAQLSGTVRTDVQNAIRRAVGGRTRVITLGATEVSGLVHDHPNLRTAYPELLSLSDLRHLISEAVNHGIRARSAAFLKAAEDEARRFEPTQAYRDALARLEHWSYVVLTGPPEFGKTTIARMIALSRAADDWQVVDCDDPQDVFDTFDPARPQLFVADDAFGSTEYEPERATRWARRLEQVLVALDDTHQLVWTSRSAPLQEALRELRAKLGDRDTWPEPSRVAVDPSQLSRDERAMILYAQAKASALSDAAREVVRRTVTDIISNEHFTPERVRRLMRDLENDPAAPVEAALERASDRMRLSFERLGDDARRILIALVDEPTLEAAERHVPNADVPRTIAMLEEQFLVAGPRPARRAGRDRFARSQSRPVPLDGTEFRFVHPSWRDFVIEHLSTNAEDRRRFLERCGIGGIRLAMSTGGGATGARTLPLLVDETGLTLWRRRFLAIVESEGEDADSLLPSLEAVVADERIAGALPELLRAYAEAWRTRPLSVTTEHLEKAVSLHDRANEDTDLGLSAIWAAHYGRVSQVASRSGALSRNEIDELLAFAAVCDWAQGLTLSSFWHQLSERLYKTTIELPDRSTEVDPSDWKLGGDLESLLEFASPGDADRLDEGRHYLENYNKAYALFERDEDESWTPPPEVPSLFDVERVFADL